MTKDYGSTSNHEGSEQRRLAYRSRRGSSFMVYKTFLNEFTESNGGLLIVFLGFLTAIGIGCLIGVIPQVATQRYAETRFGYNDYDRLCNSFSSQTKPEACIRGAEYAQTIASYTAVARYMMALLSNSVAGSYSDRYGRRGMNVSSPCCFV